ncbi:MAG: GerMN domain-containing protein [Candidatus Buchananbacteria bacterium]
MDSDKTSDSDLSQESGQSPAPTDNRPQEISDGSKINDVFEPDFDNIGGIEDLNQNNEEYLRPNPAPEDQDKIAIEDKIDSSLNIEGDNQVVFSDDSGSMENKTVKRSNNLVPGIIIGIIVIVVIVIAWAWTEVNTKKEVINVSDINKNVKITVSNEKEKGSVTIINSTGTVVAGKNLVNAEVFGDKVKILAFFGNSGYNKDSIDCSLVYPLERFIDNKYNSLEIDTIRGLLEPLSVEEKAQGYYSAIPEGTILKQLKISGDTAEVSLSGKIATMGGSCAVSAVRSQITKTLMQFPDIKNVNICIDGNCNQDEVLQP